MSISLLAAAVATLAAVMFTLMLVLGCVRSPRIDFAAWISAAAALAVALAVQALGFAHGFSPATFRAVQICGQLIAPLALLWGLAEVTATRFGARFTIRLALAALAVVAGVIMATDPLGGGTFSIAWPAASAHYQLLPGMALNLVAIVTVISALVAVLIAGVRSGRAAEWRALLWPVLMVAGAALVIEALRLKLPAKSGYPVLCLIAVALTWFAGRRLRTALPGGTGGGQAGGWGDAGWYGEDTGYGELYRTGTGGFMAIDTGYGDTYRTGDDTGYGDMYRTGAGRLTGADTGYGDFYPADTGYQDDYRSDTGEYGPGPDTGYGLYREPDTGFGEEGGYAPSGGDGAAAGLVETGDMLPAVGLPPPIPPEDSPDTSRLYGQIAIYTLLEGRAAEFDALAQEVVAEVRAREPGTLIYVMHGVPSAPMQRILYEVYRDEAAYAEHGRQPYIRQFEEGRRPYVLATNVIELGVHHAKVEALDAAPPAPPAPAGRPARAWGNGSR